MIRFLKLEIFGTADCRMCPSWGGGSKWLYQLENVGALESSLFSKLHIFQCVGKIFCMEFQRYPLKFHTIYLTHTLKDTIFIQFTNAKIYELVHVFLRRPLLFWGRICFRYCMHDPKRFCLKISKIKSLQVQWKTWLQLRRESWLRSPIYTGECITVMS